MCSFYTFGNNKRAGIFEGRKSKITKNTRIFIVNNSLYSVLQLLEYAILWKCTCVYEFAPCGNAKAFLYFGFSLFSHNFSFVLPFLFSCRFYFRLSFFSHHFIPAACVYRCGIYARAIYFEYLNQSNAFFMWSNRNLVIRNADEYAPKRIHHTHTHIYK